MAAEWWSGIEMRHLVALDAVAREGSFRRAATRLGYVQSAISHQIAALEGLIGKRLIERSRGTRPLALTPAGEILLAHTDALIARVRAAQADLAALDGEGAAALRVGATPDMLARLVPSFLRVYGAPVSLHETSSTRALLAALVRGELDIALAETPLPRGPLDAVPLCADPFVVLLQAGAPLTTRRRLVNCDELGRLPLSPRAPTRLRSSRPRALRVQASACARRRCLSRSPADRRTRRFASTTPINLGLPPASHLPTVLCDERKPGAALHHPPVALGSRALHRRHARDVRDLLRHPGGPRAPDVRSARDTRVHRARAAFPRHRSPGAVPVRSLPRPAGPAAFARTLVHEPSGRHA